MPKPVWPHSKTVCRFAAVGDGGSRDIPNAENNFQLSECVWIIAVRFECFHETKQITVASISGKGRHG
jgi:hypothetical protein